MPFKPVDVGDVGDASSFLSPTRIRVRLQSVKRKREIIAPARSWANRDLRLQVSECAKRLGLQSLAGNACLLSKV